mmetsp:Transcript_19219/g.41534  ORF Transcript_19219/g.41534 Transcript_19219/m.41534 type:complete len:119 (-) Transcript_19219:659-1015(-)|eukprot:CAMPEP_0202891076 /NCGR_PEP_ID=MMETSP1392-20130828/1255_1 /ASSEMBLY_ACC=CAM_ASM_000868 /TAXON_ID=225041 /ORGANISM="Chlamydomonas chlamydogama, Strain SAG 11-48b" /LENGTH=118 /DNA_ID=CAMNT_0049574749 /DNA_START=138 /DNA_END=494 /DNA_ORIENTATION=+
MYIEDFEAFMQQAEEVYRARPLETRYCIKYRHCDGKLVLKVTDDRTCLQFKTDQQQDLKKLERITSMFFALFARGDLPEGEPMQVDTTQQQQQQQQQAASAAVASAAAARGKKSRRKG